MKEFKEHEGRYGRYIRSWKQMEDMETMIEMGYEENDAALIPEIQEMLDEFQKILTVSVSNTSFRRI